MKGEKVALEKELNLKQCFQFLRRLYKLWYVIKPIRFVFLNFFQSILLLAHLKSNFFSDTFLLNNFNSVVSIFTFFYFLIVHISLPYRTILEIILVLHSLSDLIKYISFALLKELISVVFNLEFCLVDFWVSWGFKVLLFLLSTAAAKKSFKLVCECHQFLSGFLASHVSQLMIRVITRWYRELWTDFLALILQAEENPSNHQLGVRR